MTDTVVSSATKEVVIGFDRPFVIIGERINPTGRKILAAEMAAGDFTRVESDARAQVEAGAHMLDVNAGIPLADEPAILARAIQLVQSITDVPLSIDFLHRRRAGGGGLPYKAATALVNSVTGEDERLESVLPLVKKYGAAVIAISNDETGISEDPDASYAVAKKIVERAADRRHPGLRCRRRSAGDAHRRDQSGGRSSDAAGAPAAHRTEGEYPACAPEHQLSGLPNRDGINSGVSHHGDGGGHDFGHHQSHARGGRQGLHGRGRHAGTRSGLRPLDQAISRHALQHGRGRGRRFLLGYGARRAAAAKAAIADVRRRGGPFAWRRATPSSYSPRPANGEISRSARRCCRPRAAWEWILTQSAADAVFAAVARCWLPKANSPNMASPHRARVCRLSANLRSAAARSAGGRPPLVLFRARRSRCGDRCAGEQPGAPSGGAQGSRRAHDQARSGGASALRASQAAGHA